MTAIVDLFAGPGGWDLAASCLGMRPLGIPQPMYEVVRRNLLQAGIVAPATAPPDATTSTS